ncbi:cryptochrome/photolyase family protein [Dechloromonas sp.]|uniref:cryptochrome/photolyase family protein n=1 Tax=Dechloromonas sp. TaxID=1917218 RepID=UPI0011F78F47|nr:cryptochrome/photolyase family protein [Dechloromonas sp.]MBU3697215.1 cryptochrome/photolyase family protein [Dechloromonas sp.]TEX48609.1 MAG: cryptochrome/photolyase family protein [Rhodocyclaceae bacterium]
MRRHFLILGDQLHPDPHPLLVDFNPAHDHLLMIEAADEAQHVWSHRARIALFLSAMRHRADGFRQLGLPIDYLTLGSHPHARLADALSAHLATHPTSVVVMLEAGDLRLQDALRQACDAAGSALLVRPDPHFLCSLDDFMRWAGDKPGLRMEFFYRWQRQRHNILMADGEPVGGQWNFDADNRQPFGRQGPPPRPQAPRFARDALTQAVIDEVRARFPDHPGSLDDFAWPVTLAEAEAALADFIRHRLPDFGRWQDAMWAGEPFLWHSLLSAALNLKLISPRQVIDAAVQAWQDGKAPLPAVEGFVRQILGWREFVRGIYFRHMPALAESNQYAHHTPLPDWYWTGKTQARCLADSIGQTLLHGYAHHIQRLMITGNFALIAGLEPRAVADWYLAVYVDAVAWVEEPNTLGMALNAWPGMTSKPYCASGAYIKRMSNYCSGCRYRPEQRTGASACPFTTFYWDFLIRHQPRFASNPRMALPLKHVARMSEAERSAITDYAEKLRQNLEAI